MLEENLNLESKMVTKNLRENIVEYLEEIEKLSGIKISDKQRTELIKYVGSTNFRIIDPKLLRESFNLCREDLKKEWVKNSREESKNWPYIINNNGFRGNSFTAHHIIKINVSGPNEWWNIFPMEYLGHDFLHKSGGNICYKIFEENVRTYSFDDAKTRINNIVKDTQEGELLERINRDYKIMKDLGCKDVVDKYTKELGYYLRLIINKGYINLAKDILKEYSNSYKLITVDLLKECLNRDNEKFIIGLIHKQKDLIIKHGVDILVKACKLKRRSVVNYILDMKECPDINSLYRENLITVKDVSNVTKRTIFDYACTSDDIEIIKSFVDKKGATFNNIDDSRKDLILHDVKSRGIRNYLREMKETTNNKAKSDIERIEKELGQYREWFNVKK